MKHLLIFLLFLGCSHKSPKEWANRNGYQIDYMKTDQLTHHEICNGPIYYIHAHRYYFEHLLDSHIKLCCTQNLCYPISITEFDASKPYGDSGASWTSK